ncbi:methionyl-tRNA formyltransferase [Candidatus Nomurabacteria bacterium RIFCSPLOWO2_01_FULL_36_10b]|uniref:methionyl-tRNA formyltransferase n=1 Tax=Candidatus Nomurabacteria bacterium RIFCSPLOWO2_01_FULL_36_10b TaxID=1801766 RepID=A0A1F6WQ21_9BACT|nr:MAG: methionyl-tRNA formyltransferase [Candidatus Nomurabacteria bacterium RIFCSPLOWO2_01_FULL_36_10b]
MKHNIAFFGTPNICIPVLNALRDADYLPSLIITNPDRPFGRKQSELVPPPAKVWALEHNIKVLQPEKIDESFYEEMKKHSWDIFIVIAYGHIMPESLIALPKHGTVNIHYSLLPRWRGATPIEAVILAGDAETGITIQSMQYELDAGPILAQESIPLTGHEYATDLYNHLGEKGAELLIQILPSIFDGTIAQREQDITKITHCHKTQKSDGELLKTDTDEIKWRKYRAYYGWPDVFFFDAQGKRVKVTEADFINETFIIKKVIREGESEKMY